MEFGFIHGLVFIAFLAIVFMFGAVMGSKTGWPFGKRDQSRQRFKDL